MTTKQYIKGGTVAAVTIAAIVLDQEVFKAAGISFLPRLLAVMAIGSLAAWLLVRAVDRIADR